MQYLLGAKYHRPTAIASSRSELNILIDQVDFNHCNESVLNINLKLCLLVFELPFVI